MYNNQTMPPQDFDEWANLARSDPHAFEVQRRQIIDRAILQAPVHKQQRLRCMQWKLDQIRSTSRTPMVACLRMNRMLWEAVAGDHGLLASLTRPDLAHRRAPSRMKTGGTTVIPFRR